MEEQRNQSDYHFVILGDGDDYLQDMFAEVTGDANVEFIPHAIPYRLKLRSFWQRALYRIHFNHVINRLIKLPFKEAWYRHFYEGAPSDKLCFVFFMDALLPQYIPLFNVLRNTYPQCRFALYLIDLVSSRKGALDVSMIKRYMDVAVTYDKTEAKTYDLLYYPNFISKLEIEEDPQIPESDFCFIGTAKDRAGRVNDLYGTLSRMGFRCHFIVCDEQRKGGAGLSDGIELIRKPLPYRDYLKHIARSKCLVEIPQAGAQGYTLRVSEALLYGKRLISDSAAIRDLPFFRPDQFLFFSKDLGKKDLEAFLGGDPPRPRPSSACETSAKGFLDFLSAQLTGKEKGGETLS